MATSTNKTAAFGVKLIHKCMSKHRYIQKNGLFGALYGLVESFFKNDEGHNVTVNGDRYRAMITNIFIPELNNHDVQELWFQQDGATCHTGSCHNRLIERHSVVYADKPQTLDHLEDNIHRVIADIRPQMLEKVIENWTSGLDYIRASHGSPMPEIISKITREHETTPLRVKEDIEDVLSELGNEVQRLHLLVETSRTLLLSASCCCLLYGAVGSLVVRASDSRPEGLGSMLDVTKYPPSAHGVRAR
ncbi:uncharacterized protein TNCV_186521 [Trichonephila clavipes]|nr:uncharacterized protein TNCV_186521 [Trichonephila clavipes]